MKWTESPDQKFADDQRGWKKGRRRKWNKAVEDRITKIYQNLADDPNSFFVGPSAIAQKWRVAYPGENVPPLRTIGQIMSDLKLSSKRKRGRNQGASRYLCYPEHTIYTRLNGRVAESDFIGKKFITGRSEPVNFISFCFKKEPKLRYFKRVRAQTADCFITECERFFKKFEKPDYLKVDNCLATAGSASGKRNISRTMRFLLNNQVVPIFSVPRKPFSQASIEGNNSVFSRFFWNKIHFNSLQEIDKRLNDFNICSEGYCGYQKPLKAKRPDRNFIPRIYFIRQVAEDKENSHAFIGLLNERMRLSKSYINYFVLAEWNLKEEVMYVYFEKDQKQKLIKKVPFKANVKSKQGALISFCY